MFPVYPEVPTCKISVKIHFNEIILMQKRLREPTKVEEELNGGEKKPYVPMCVHCSTILCILHTYTSNRTFPNIIVARRNISHYGKLFICSFLVMHSLLRILFSFPEYTSERM